MKETLQVVNQLKKKGIISDYAIGGAVASFFYLEATLTDDLDVFIYMDNEQKTIISLSPLFKGLAEEGYNEFKREGVIIDKWPVQFLPVSTELEKEAFEKADQQIIEGEELKAFSAEYLMALCVQVGRPKDKIRLVQFLKEKCFDETKLNDILYRHHLADKYNKIRNALEE